MNCGICGSFYFSWVYPVFCTTNVERVYEWIYAFRKVITFEICILRNNGVTQITLIWKKHTMIITQVILFPGICITVLSPKIEIKCIILTMHHLQFIVCHGVYYSDIVRLWPYFQYFRKYLPNDIFICVCQYNLHPDHKNLPKSLWCFLCFTITIVRFFIVSVVASVGHMPSG